jgi:uncharacterized protein (TIGR01244 family)
MTDQPSCEDPTDIRGWLRLGPAVTTSGRLQADDVARLAAIGVRHVINLALDDHPDALTDEAALLAAAGIGYDHIPVPFAAPDNAHYAAFRAALGATDGPVHVHCIMNWRVSAFFHRLHREQGMAMAEVDALMAQIWNPATSTAPHAAAWAAFVAGGD